MITYHQIEQLFELKPGKEPVVSFYLNSDLRQSTVEQQKIVAKNLISERIKELSSKDLDPSVKKLIKADLERVLKFVEDELTGGHSYRGLVVFCSGPLDFWQIYRLPRSVKDAAIVDYKPYIRPLTVILDEYHRFAVLLVDREKAQLYEFYMGEIMEHEHVFDEVPGKVRIAGWYGLEERRIERHIEDHVHRHYKRVAEILFRHFKKHHFDYLILGGHEAELPVFENHLHPYLRERIAGRFHVDETYLRKDKPKIKEQVLSIEEQFERNHELKLVEEVLQKARSQDLGVLGLKPTLEALRLGAVHTLLIDDDWTTRGVVCNQCGYLGTEGKNCPICHAALTEKEDIVEEAIELAAQQNAYIEHIYADSPLSQEGHIGALLRFRPNLMNI